MEKRHGLRLWFETHGRGREQRLCKPSERTFTGAHSRYLPTHSSTCQEACFQGRNHPGAYQGGFPTARWAYHCQEAEMVEFFQEGVTLGLTSKENACFIGAKGAQA